jgi:CPA1 family monovalent cation:H+ antiporter
MITAGFHEAQMILLLLLLFVAVFATLARKLQIPYPIVLVVAGLLLGFVPGVPRVTLDPNLIFLVALPPLLYAAAWVTSWRDLSHNLVSIAMLALGLVGFTAAAVAWAGPWLFPGFDWRSGFVLGAAVAPTDAIAATSIARRIGLPKNIIDLLEGESLINDATGLLALEFAISMVIGGHIPTVGEAALRLGYLIAAGCVTGLVIGRLAEWFEHRIDDGPVEIALSILIPYAAYLAAEAIHGSGVLAVVAAGTYLGRRSSQFFSARVRLQANSVWRAVEFILNGFVFVLIGLQLPAILAGIRELKIHIAIFYAALFSLFLILVRLLWTFPGLYAAGFIRSRLLGQKETRPEVRSVFVVGWTGMRGVLALAAAMSLPEVLDNGTRFPHRDLIIFLIFSAILVTLVLQGLTLPSLVRFLGLAGSTPAQENRSARRTVLSAALDRLHQLRRTGPVDLVPIYDDLELHYRRRIAGHNLEYLDLSRELLSAEREAALHLRETGQVSDESLRELEHEMDLNEARLLAATEHQ